MAFSGVDFSFEQRQRTVRELEMYRRQGVVIARDILAVLTPENFDRLWPYIADVLNRLFLAQQEAGRDAMTAYMGAVAVGVGAHLTGQRVMAVPAAALMRNGNLPSGMPWARLTGSGAAATVHRVQNGMPLPVALDYLKGQMVAAVAEQAHDEARKVATDILQAQQRGDFNIEEAVKPLPHANLSNDEWRIAMNQGDTSPATARKLAKANKGVTRYIRVPSPGACPFCLLLATRGAVYYADSWGSSKTFRKNGEPKAHAHCHCVVLPEPAPGAWRNTIIGDPAEYAAAIWTAPKSKRQYHLGTLATAKQVLTHGDVERLKYVLAA